MYVENAYNIKTPPKSLSEDLFKALSKGGVRKDLYIITANIWQDNTKKCVILPSIKNLCNIPSEGPKRNQPPETIFLLPANKFLHNLDKNSFFFN